MTLYLDALDLIGKPYRLFPTRFKKVEEMGGTVDNSHDEVAVIKLHGSVDWFDRTSYTRREKSYRESGLTKSPNNLVFGPASPASTEPVLKGPQFEDDPMTGIYRVVDGLEEIYKHAPNLLVSPFMLAPSSMKVLYADRLRYSFWGLGQAGGYNLGLIVIGYSIPRHDDYARQLLMRIFANYQRLWWDENFLGMKKKPALLIDYRNNPKSEDKYRLIYSFSEEEKTHYYLSGFDSNAVAAIRNLT